MLSIVVPEREYFDERTNKFLTVKGRTLQLEHSLVSMSKWEAKWKKPFIKNGKDKMTGEEFLDYVRCMTLTQNVDPMTYMNLTRSNVTEIENYINDPMTATWFSEDKNKRRVPSREVITTEVIYYYMIALNIPMECQKWHFNRLWTLIRVCNIKNQPPKKRGKKERIADAKTRAEINAQRKKLLNTSG